MILRKLKTYKKELKKTIRAFGTNSGGCGDSYGDGPNKGGSSSNYNNNQK